MKRPEIRIYLSDNLYGLIKEKAETYGLSVTMYAKYVLIKDVDAPLTEISHSRKGLDD